MSEEKSEEEKKLEKEVNKEIRKDKFKYMVVCIIIGLVIGQVKLGLFDFFGVNDDVEYENTSNTSLVDLPERTFSELTPATINTNAFIPDVTESYSYLDIEYKLPETYYKDYSHTITDKLSYTTGVIDNQEYDITIEVAEASGIAIEDYAIALQTTISNFNGYNTEILGGPNTERINGNDWYYYKAKHKSTTDKLLEYSEYYCTIYNDRIYQISFSIVRNDGIEPDMDDVRNFLNIKTSLNFK